MCTVLHNALADRHIYVIVIVRLVCDMAQTQHEARGREDNVNGADVAANQCDRSIYVRKFSERK